MLNTLLEQYNVILASGSPRRQQFLKDLQSSTSSVKLFDVEEVYSDTTSQERRNSRPIWQTLKAQSF